MGLDTTHNAWHGPYSSFNRFRHELAKKIGIDLDEYIGYGDKGYKDLKSIEHPLRDFFDHSDCDGILTPEQCKTIASGLNEVLRGIPVPKNPHFDDGPLIYNIIQFRDGCLEAYSKKENLEFH